MNILFIGNSYTYYNDMPKMLESLARAAGFYAEVASVTKGGYTLARLASDDNENGRRVTSALSGDMKYDRVILQEQSVLPAAEPERFAEGLRAITEKLKEYQPQAVPVLYETWGRKAGNDTLAEHGWTTAAMHALLHSAYDAAGAALGCAVSHVGFAFLDVYENAAGIELYNADMTHPSPAGSYLAACVHFATLFGASPVGNEYTAGLPADDAELLQRAAARAAGV